MITTIKAGHHGINVQNLKGARITTWPSTNLQADLMWFIIHLSSNQPKTNCASPLDEQFRQPWLQLLLQIMFALSPKWQPCHKLINFEWPITLLLKNGLLQSTLQLYLCSSIEEYDFSSENMGLLKNRIAHLWEGGQGIIALKVEFGMERWCSHFLQNEI